MHPADPIQRQGIGETTCLEHVTDFRIIARHERCGLVWLNGRPGPCREYLARDPVQGPKYYSGYIHQLIILIES